MEDRHDAKRSALSLVTDGIQLPARFQSTDCPYNTHILAHSTGAFVVREAFDDADDSDMQPWRINQVVFVAADVSSLSLSASNAKSRAIFTHSARLTNYYSRHDTVLGISNLKRGGVLPRAGRIGLPADAPVMSANVDTSGRWNDLHRAQPGDAGDPHAWYFEDTTFAKDLKATLDGDDRHVIETRQQSDRGWVLR